LHSNNKKENWIQPRAALISGIVLAAAALRVVPHPINFAPIGALAVPLLSLLAGDIFIGFHRLIPYVYANFLASVAIGFLLRRKKSAPRIGAATLAGAIQFFLVTNFAVWLTSTGSYPKNFSGLAECYLAGVPFFWNTLAGDAFYVALLFGAMALAEKRFPSLREPLTAEAAQNLAFR
jgi:hypothetical protein